MSEDTAGPWCVPSKDWPSLAVAVAQATDGTHIRLQANYTERLDAPLIIDMALLIEGPDDLSASLIGEEGLVVNAYMTESAVVLRRLKLRSFSAPALIIAGGCTVEHCDIESRVSGIEVASCVGSAARILGTVVRGCEVGVSLAGGASAADLQGTHIEGCASGVAVTGLGVEEGWSEVLGSLTGATFGNNGDANLRLRGWSVREVGSGIVREAPPGGEVVAAGWPQEQCSVVVPTDRGAVIMLFSGGRVNTTLFDEDDEQESLDSGQAGDGDAAGERDTLNGSFSVRSLGAVSDSVPVPTSSEP